MEVRHAGAHCRIRTGQNKTVFFMLCAAVLSMVMLIAFLPLNAFAIEADPAESGPEDPVFFDQRNPVVASFLEEAQYDPNVLYYSLTDICRQNAMERGMDWVHPNQYRVQAEYAGTFCLNGPGATREIRKEVQEGEEIVFPSLVPGYSYQWSITAEDGTAWQHGVFNPYGSLRVIPLEGVYNVRDMGGWPTGSGTLRYGLLFRGSALEYNEYRLARDADLQELERLNIRLEVDLRSDAEAWGHDLLMEKAQDRSMIPGASYVRIPIMGYYNGVVQDSDRYPMTVAALEQIIDSVIQGRPVFIHCAAGADRTGTIAVLLEGLLGVSRSDIDKDYELTTFGSDNGLRSRAFDEYLSLMYGISLAGGDTFEDQCINWFLKAGFDVDTLNLFRQVMTVGEVEKIMVPEAAA